MAVAFIPKDDVMDVFESMLKSGDYDDLPVFIECFEDNYLGIPGRRGRRSDARFPISLWNQYERVIQNLPRSNNSLEGWHQAFNSMVNISNPTVIRLARKLQQKQHNSNIRRLQQMSGQPQPRKNPSMSESMQHCVQ